MVDKKYIPDRGDVVWINFNPQAGREQASKRPAIVLSPKQYNEKTSLAVVCPMTSQIKDYPFEILIKSKKITGVILADQIKSLDWNQRRVDFIQKINNLELKEIQEKIIALIKL